MTDAFWRLGERVRYTNPLGRRWDVDPEARSYDNAGIKSWVPRPHYGDPVEGIVVGVRTLVNGKNHYIGPDEGTTFEPREWFTAVMVVRDLRRKPEFVLPENIERLETP